ncbi:hypothetical protein ACE38V_04630 [Cytobacillus sp. Hz8]|uniref:hypothetical protein n=1 Tax=Cytobacillus sp. Hz8 TaxID=3347168 RepID=UPI0035D87589
MFDPTAFENMKVVLEGALYDRDIEGDIAIINRSDVMNLAKLSREYEVTFTLKEKSMTQCTVKLRSNLENLAAELLPAMKSEQLSGCTLSIVFTVEHYDDLDLHEEIANVLTDVWGIERTYQHKMILDPFQEHDVITKEISIDFNRLIYEDQMDDFINMIDSMVVSIKNINQIIINY